MSDLNGAADITEGADTVDESTLLTGDTPVEGGDETPKDEEGSSEEAKAEGEKEDDKPAGAPESYEDFVLPDGVTLDPEVDAGLKALAKELNLPQDQAQKVAELGAKQAQRFVDQQVQAVENAAKQWLADTKADPEIGGDKLPDTLSAAALAMKALGTPELKALLNTSKLGNHPEFVRFMAKAGKAISEDSFIPGDRNARQQPDSARRLYPNSNHV